MQIRPATVADAEAIERIRVRGWQVGYRDVFPPERLDAQPIDGSRWVDWFADPPQDQIGFVAEDELGVLGWVTVGESPLPLVGELHGLYVDPGRWGEGAGRALVARAEAELAKRWDDAILWTLADIPRTRRFYEANGWSFDGTTNTFERFDVAARTVRYAKSLKSSTSRS